MQDSAVILFVGEVGEGRPDEKASLLAFSSHLLELGASKACQGVIQFAPQVLLAMKPPLEDQPDRPGRSHHFVIG